MYIRRPLVWVCLSCILLFGIYRLCWGEQDDRRYYIFQNMLGEQGKDACVRGTVDHIERKKSSCYLYLRKVLVVLSGTDTHTYSLSELLVSLPKEPDLQPGYQIRLEGRLMDFSRASNPGQFDSKNYYREKNIYYQMQAKTVQVTDHTADPLKTLLKKLREQLELVIGQCLPEQEAGIVSAMLLGEKSRLDQETRNLYQKNGIGHLLAISGLHVTVFCMAVYRLLLACYLPRGAAVPIAFFVLYCYGALTGFGVSTSRAVIMMVLYLLAELIHRSYDMLSALAFSALVILVQKPFAVTSCSFLLSYGAILGIALVFPALRRIFYGDEKQQRERRRTIQRAEKECRADGGLHLGKLWIMQLCEALQMNLLLSISIQISIVPVILYFYYEIPLYGVLLNLLVLPLAPVLILLSALGSLSGLFFLPAARFLFGGVWGILNLYELLCRMFSQLPCAVVLTGRPALFLLVLYYILAGAGILFAYQNNIRKKQALILWGIAAMSVLLPLPSGYFSMTFLDVGQGDAIFFRTPGGKNFLVDGGSSSQSQVGIYCILPYLKYYGIGHIDYMIMTHADEDHISGQRELLKQSGSGGVRIRRLLLPEPEAEKREDRAYQGLIKLADDCDTPVQYLHAGEYLQTEQLQIQCIHPVKDFACESANAYSTTLSICWNETGFLLCGDLEGEGEEAVIRWFQNSPEESLMQYDILKVAHHGSKNSTSTEFLEKVRPGAAIISCGKHNRYGHPHGELLSRLEQFCLQIARTDEEGAVTVFSDGRKVTVKTYRSAKISTKRNLS